MAEALPEALAPGDSRDLYALLGISKGASPQEVGKAYRRMALVAHPDKAKAREPDVPEEVHQRRFQTLQRVYDILRDDEKRKVYDQTGSVSAAEGRDAPVEGDFDELYAYYRQHFPQVKREDIEAFERSFRESEEERASLLELYEKHKGEMDVVYEYLLSSREGDDDERFTRIIDDAIRDGTVKEYRAYASWKASTAERRKKLAKRKKREAKEAERALAELQAAGAGRGGGGGGGGGGANDMDALMLAINKKNKARAESGFLEALQAKYAGPKHKGGKGKKR